jgi:hypothetical protein
MLWKRYWPYFYICILFVGSLIVDLQMPSQKLVRNPAATVYGKTCREMIRKFLEHEPEYKLPRYSVVTLSYKRSTAKYLNSLVKLPMKERIESIQKLGKYRGRSKELNNSYIWLINRALKRNILNYSAVKQLVEASQNDPIPLTKFSMVKVGFNRDSLKKLMKAEELLDEFLNEKYSEEVIIDKYKVWFADISAEELSLIKDAFTRDEKEVRALRRFLHYTRTLSNEERILALDHAHEIYLETSGKKWIVNFKREVDRLKNYRAKHKEKYLRRQSTRDEAAIERANAHAEGLSRVYEKLYFGCKNTDSNQVQKQAAKTYGKFILTLAPATAATSYAVVNWDKEKDAKWLTGMAYDVTIVTFLNFFAAKVLSGPADGHLKKLAKSMGLFGTVDLVTAPLYNALFSPSEEEREKALNSLVKDSKEKEKLKEFIKFIVEKDHSQSVEESLLQLIKHEDGSEVTIDDLYNMNPEELLSDNMKDEFLGLLAEKMYEDDKGDWISSGNQGLDRFWYHRTWDITSFPLDIYANMLIFQRLCVTTNPVKARFEAAMLFLAYRAINDIGYYYFRGEAINQ